MEIPNQATFSTEALTLISAPGISIYNGPLLMITAHYISPSASDVSLSGLIYVDHMIKVLKHLTVLSFDAVGLVQ